MLQEPALETAFDNALSEIQQMMDIWYKTVPGDFVSYPKVTSLHTKMLPEPRLRGDPHALNMRGEKFNIFQAGVVSLIRAPRNVTSGGRPLLEVKAEIAHLDETLCHLAYVRSILVTGAAVGGSDKMGDAVNFSLVNLKD